MKQRIKNILRWIALPFAAGLTICFCSVVSVFIYFNLSGYVDGASQPGIDVMGVAIIGWILSGMPVWFQSFWIAPKYKKITAWIMSGVFCGTPLAIVFGALVLNLIGF